MSTNASHSRYRRCRTREAAIGLLLAFAIPFTAANAAPPQKEDTANGVLLVASPGLQDPNFRHAVVLVTHTPDGGSIGFIINRPGTRSLAEILPNNEMMQRFTEPLFQGGPVEANGLFAMLRAKGDVPGTLRVLDDVSFALDPAVIERLLHDPPGKVRFFNGYAGWGPGQLAFELSRGGWYVLSADPDTVFRKNTDTLWKDMLLRAQAVMAFLR